jgi:hypothetical protein
MIVKLLAIDTSVEPIRTEKLELSATNPTKLNETILRLLNTMGKSSHVLMGYHGELMTCHHVAERGPSDKFMKVKIKYHPLSSEVLD